jgi:hypothetical protein
MHRIILFFFDLEYCVITNMAHDNGDVTESWLTTLIREDPMLQQMLEKSPFLAKIMKSDPQPSHNTKESDPQPSHNTKESDPQPSHNTKESDPQLPPPPPSSPSLSDLAEDDVSNNDDDDDDDDDDSVVSDEIIYYGQEDNEEGLLKQIHIPPCPGLKPELDLKRLWYIPMGANEFETTICEECFIQYCSEKIDEYVVRNLDGACTCDYVKSETDGYSIHQDGISFSLIDVETMESFPISRTSDTSAQVKIPSGRTFMMYCQKIGICPNVIMTMRMLLVNEKQVDTYKSLFVRNGFEIYGYNSGSSFFPQCDSTIELQIKKWISTPVGPNDQLECNSGTQGKVMLIRESDGCIYSSGPEVYKFSSVLTALGHLVNFKIDVKYED